MPNHPLAARLAARYLRASGLAHELEATIARLLLPGAEQADFGKAADWLMEHFQFKTSRTPKGQAKNKENLGYLYNILAVAHTTQEAYWKLENAQNNVVQAWAHLKDHIPELVAAFTSEGGVKAITREKKVGGNTYVNLVGAPDKTLEGMIDTVEAAFGSLKGWHQKALAGGVKVVFAGPKEFRGTSSGSYHQADDSLFIRATSGGRLDKTPAGTYGSLGYVIVHELGHRYERKQPSLPRNFDSGGWFTSRYSLKEGETFAELFAISNLGITGPWDPDIVTRFDAVMG